MWHLFKHKNKTFDFAYVVNGKFICGSNQGYENRSDAIKTLFNLIDAHSDMTDQGWDIQDDTGSYSKMITIFKDGKQLMLDTKPDKRYTPAL